MPDPDEVAADPGPEDPAPATPELRLPDRLGPIVLAAVALLMVGFIVGRVTAPDTEDESAATTTTVPTVAFPMGDQDRGGYWAFAGITPRVSDTFDRRDADDDLGQTDTGDRWAGAGGTFGVLDQQAAAAGGDELSFATVDGGRPAQLTEATLMVVEPGSGIVFRFLDVDNYWSLTADPERGVWALTRVVDGTPAVVGEAPGPVADGTTVSVSHQGTDIQVLIDGQAAVRASDGALRNATASGLIAPSDGSGQVRWDRFFVGDLPPLP